MTVCFPPTDSTGEGEEKHRSMKPAAGQILPQYLQQDSTLKSGGQGRPKGRPKGAKSVRVVSC